MDYLAGPLPGLNELVEADQNKNVRFSYVSCKPASNSEPDSTNVSCRYFDDTAFKKFCEEPLKVMCQLILAFGRKYIEALCHWSYAQYLVYIRSYRSLLSTDFQKIKEKAGTIMTKKALKQICVTDSAECSKNEREIERELCSVTRNGFSGLID